MILLERIAKAREERDAAESRFRATLKAARKRHSWAEIAAVSGLSKHGVRYLVNDENHHRKKERAI